MAPQQSARTLGGQDKKGSKVHGQYNSSRETKAAFAAIHFCLLAWAAWLLLGGGAATVLAPFGIGQVEGVAIRRVMLIAAGFVYWARMTVGLFVFLRRGVGWAEVATVSAWLFVVHTTFAILGATNAGSVGPLLLLGILFYILGSVTNTGSELQRHLWKHDRANAGHLYTGGWFRFARHINYFGDTILFTGFALMTGRFASLVIPVIMTFGFLFEHGPKLDRYLSTRYGKEYEDWASHTARFVPWVY